MIASVIANTSRARNQRPFRPEDFMPKFGWDTESPAEMQAETPAERNKRLLDQVVKLNTLFGGQDLRSKN